MGLQTLWHIREGSPIFSDLGCFSGRVLSKTKSVTPHFFYISDITNSSSFNGKICRKKSMLENFRANVLKSHSSKMVVTQLRNVLICLFVRVAVNVYFKWFVVKSNSRRNLLSISIRTSRDRVYNCLARSESNFMIKSTEFCEERFVTA